MPHLSFEYSGGVETWADMAAFADHMRRAMLATGVFPPGGVRVRGFRADAASVADGGPHDFLDMTLRLGAGRDAATKRRAVEALYAAAEAFLAPLAAERSFALSLEAREIDPDLSLKRYNSVRDQMKSVT